LRLSSDKVSVKPTNVSLCTYENVYVNMPAFGLGKVGLLVEAK